MAEPNVGLMADTVSTRADIERLLPLHCRRSGWYDEGPLKGRVRPTKLLNSLPETCRSIWAAIQLTFV